MKRRLVLLVFFVLAAFTVSGCSPAEEELAAKHPGRRFAIKIDRAYSD